MWSVSEKKSVSGFKPPGLVSRVSQMKNPNWIRKKELAKGGREISVAFISLEIFHSHFALINCHASYDCIIQTK
jgi:hypothetical protein